MKKTFALLMTAILLTLFTSVASAGGWAVVTLDHMLTNVVANEPVKVGMMVRQHGQTPWAYEGVRVRGSDQSGKSFDVPAAMDERGHYTAELVFTAPGKWQWAVHSGLMPEWQAMPEVEVADPAQLESLLGATSESTATVTPSAATWTGMVSPMVLLAIGVLGFVGSGAGLYLWWRKRS